MVSTAINGHPPDPFHVSLHVVYMITKTGRMPSALGTNKDSSSATLQKRLRMLTNMF